MGRLNARMRLFILPLGKCANDKERIFTPRKDPGRWIEVPIWACLVKAVGLNILVDTGMHPVHIENPKITFAGTPYEKWIMPQMAEEDRIIHRLREIDVLPEDIDIVINTHLHFDHAGGNCLFPRATFLVQREHYQYALEIKESFQPKYFLPTGIQYDLIDGELTLLPGLEIIRCPGHVPGMQAVIIHLKDTGTIVLAGDAISLQENLSEDCWEGYWNPRLARASARRMVAIAEATNGQIFFGHDPGWWSKVKKSAQYYS